MADNNKHKEPFILFKPFIAFFKLDWDERGYVLFWIGVILLLMALTYYVATAFSILKAIVLLGLILIAIGGIGMLFGY